MIESRGFIAAWAGEPSCSTIPAYRSSFRDDAAEHTHTPHAVMEAALAHAVRNKAEAACARSDLFPSLGGASRSLRAPAAAIVQVWSDSRAPPVAGFSVTSSVPY